MTNDSLSEIDFDHLNQYVGGDPDLTAEIFGMFQQQVEMWGRMLTVDADDETWESVTHSLKGSARAVGAMKLAALCEKAEGLSGQGNRPGLREKAVQDIEHRVYLATAQIQRWEYKRKLDNIRGH